MEQGMTLEDLLGYTSREQAPKAKYNSGWNKNVKVNPVTKQKEATIDIWLHTRALFHTLWRHQFPTVREKDGKREIKNQNFKCLESETFLRRKHLRDRESGELLMPPEVCPFCILLEQVRRDIRTGDCSWTDVLFRVNSDSAVEELHAGGVTNLFSKQKKTDKENEELREAKIDLREAWKENCNASCKYIFRLVDNDNRSEGCMLSVEPASLGEAVQATIAKEMARYKKNPEKGNPVKNPYVIRFIYKPDEQVMSKKYDAQRIEDVEVDEEIQSLIVDSEPPDCSNLLKGWNVANVRTAMETYCTKKLDWDAIFGEAEKNCDPTGMYLDPQLQAAEDERDHSEDGSDEIPF